MTLELANVHAGYGGGAVVHDVCLTVPGGSVVALLGANGAGKTTLLRVASGMIRPLRGGLIMDGVDRTGSSPDALARAGIAHIPEGRSVFPHLTVRDNLRLFAAMGTERDATDRAVTAFPWIGDRMEQVAGTLSGGQQQMLALTRCYLARPDFILVDEVSLGLAPLIVDEIYSFLASLKEAGTALLLVEQYIHRALRLADFVYILHKGMVVFAGEPFEVDESDIYDRYLGAAVL